MPEKLDDAATLRALSALESRLTSLINSGLGLVTASITALAETHSRALLDQERRNSTFADRDRVEAVAENQHRTANTVQGLVGELHHLDKCVNELVKKVEDGALRASQGSFQLLSGGAQLAVTALIILGSTVLAFVLAHAGHL